MINVHLYTCQNNRSTLTIFLISDFIDKHNNTSALYNLYTVFQEYSLIISWWNPLLQYYSTLPMLVYGAMSKIGLFATVWFVGLFCIFKPSPTRIELSPFFYLSYMAAISNLKMADLYRDRKINLLPIKLESLWSDEQFDILLCMF